jgi:hypothetical protein
MPAPMPRELPVTKATFPFSRFESNVLCSSVATAMIVYASKPYLDEQHSAVSLSR